MGHHRPPAGAARLLDGAQEPPGPSWPTGGRGGPVAGGSVGPSWAAAQHPLGGRRDGPLPAHLPLLSCRQGHGGGVGRGGGAAGATVQEGAGKEGREAKHPREPLVKSVLVTVSRFSISQRPRVISPGLRHGSLEDSVKQRPNVPDVFTPLEPEHISKASLMRGLQGGGPAPREFKSGCS